MCALLGLLVHIATCISILLSVGGTQAKHFTTTASPWPLSKTETKQSWIDRPGSHDHGQEDRTEEPGESQLFRRMQPSSDLGMIRGSRQQPPEGNPHIVTAGKHEFVPSSDRRPLHIAPLQGNLAVAIIAGIHVAAHEPGHGRFAASIPPSAIAVDELVSHVRTKIRRNIPSQGFVFDPVMESTPHRMASNRLVEELLRNPGILLTRRSYKKDGPVAPQDRAVTLLYPNYVYFGGFPLRHPHDTRPTDSTSQTHYDRRRQHLALSRHSALLPSILHSTNEGPRPSQRMRPPFHPGPGFTDQSMSLAHGSAPRPPPITEHPSSSQNPRDLTLHPANPQLGHRLTQLAEEVSAHPMARPGSSQGLGLPGAGLHPMARPLPRPPRPPMLGPSPESSEHRPAAGDPPGAPGGAYGDQMHGFVEFSPGQSISHALWHRYGPPSQEEPPPALNRDEQNKWRSERAKWKQEQGRA